MKYIKLYEEFNINNVEESKKQIKRKYAEYSSINVYEKAKLRNSILLDVADKTITLENLKLLFNKVAENRGKELNGKKWYSENKKYFKESKGTYKLSKLGIKIYNRLIEMNYKEDNKKVTTNTINESLTDIEKEAIKEMLNAAVTFGAPEYHVTDVLDFSSIEDAYEAIVDTIPSSGGKKSFIKQVKDICMQLNLDCPI